MTNHMIKLMTNSMNNSMTDPMTYSMTDPLMKKKTMTKTMTMIMKKMWVQKCDVRAVSHSCDVLICYPFQASSDHGTHHVDSYLHCHLYQCCPCHISKIAQMWPISVGEPALFLMDSEFGFWGKRQPKLMEPYLAILVPLSNPFQKVTWDCAKRLSKEWMKSYQMN